MSLETGDTIIEWSRFWTENGIGGIGSQYEAAKEVKTIVDVVAEIGRTRIPLFYVEQRTNGKCARATELGQKFISCLHYDLKSIKRNYPKHRFSPLLTIFKRCVLKSKIEGHLKLSTVGTYNSLIDQIRAHIRGPAMAKRLANLKRCERRNARSAKKLLSEVRKKSSKALALRIDFEYYSEYTPGRGYKGLEVSFEDVQRHRDLMVEYLRKGPYSKYLMGYIWRIEYGFEKGYHLHFVIFFYGQRVCRDISIGDALGEYWRKVITEGKGYWHNCNKHKNSYEECGIGMLSRSDEEKWGYLEKAVRYLTKIDYYVRFLTPGKSRTFGIGGVYELQQ